MRYLMVNGKPQRLRKNPFSCQHEGIYMSQNGSKGWRHGEKPLFMWDIPLEELEPTLPHHIGRCGDDPSRCTFELVMFYRKKTYLQDRATFYMEAQAKSMEIAERHAKSLKFEP